MSYSCSWIVTPTVLIWHQKKDKVKGISVHYRDVISFQLMVWVGIIAGLWIYWRAHVPIPLILIFVFNAVISIINTVRVVSGEPYENVSFFKSRRVFDKRKAEQDIKERNLKRQ
ncbi:MAG: DUF4870 domain-containing protein [Fibrobacter sp.]|nr:DUF4870 domain-containing protein [Fibrobacter sp.]